MLLKDLLPNQKLAQELVEITDIAIDSRIVKEGSVFFAFKGRTVDGVKFVGDAVAKGARVIVCQKGQVEKGSYGDVVIIESDNPHQLLVECLGRFYADLPENILAVTGTNGKTSTVSLNSQYKSSKVFELSN